MVAGPAILDDLAHDVLPVWQRRVELYQVLPQRRQPAVAHLVRDVDLSSLNRLYDHRRRGAAAAQAAGY